METDSSVRGLKRTSVGRRNGLSRALLGPSLMILLCACTVGASIQTPALTGSWTIEFNEGQTQVLLQFNGQPSGSGTFLTLDPVTRQPLSSATQAAWVLNGQSPTIFSFTISGEAELPNPAGGLETGSLQLSASSAPSVPVTALSGWGQFDPGGPGDTRGSEPPQFNFTAIQVSSSPPSALSVGDISTQPMHKAKRGQDLTISWNIENQLALTSQQILISIDGGHSFQLIAASIDPLDRTYTWPIPSSFPKTRNGFVQVTATDESGNSASAVSTAPIRIK